MVQVGEALELEENMEVVEVVGGVEAVEAVGLL